MSDTTPPKRALEHAPVLFPRDADGELLVGGQRLSVLAERVGQTPFYAYDRQLLKARVAELRGERDRTVEWLRMQGLTVADSDANFVLFGTFPDRHAVWQGLLDRGVLIRETGPVADGAGWLRVSIGTPAEMGSFRSALTEVMEEQA